MNWFSRGGTDRFEVAWNHGAPSPCFVLENGASVAVKITRLGGHVDQRVVQVAADDGVVVVSIPRGDLERTAATIVVDVSLQLTPNAGLVASVEGQGPPLTSSIRSQTQISSPSQGGTPVAPPCKSPIKITRLDFLPGAGGLKDLVEAGWEARSPDSSCVSLNSFQVDAKVTRVVNSTKGTTQDFLNRATVTGKDRGARVELDGKGEIKSFSIQVRATAGRPFTATAHLEKQLRFVGAL
jgi:hypothetical protein